MERERARMRKRERSSEKMTKYLAEWRWLKCWNQLKPIEMIIMFLLGRRRHRRMWLEPKTERSADQREKEKIIQIQALFCSVQFSDR